MKLTASLALPLLLALSLATDAKAQVAFANVTYLTSGGGDTDMANTTVLTYTITIMGGIDRTLIVPVVTHKPGTGGADASTVSSVSISGGPGPLPVTNLTLYDLEPLDLVFTSTTSSSGDVRITLFHSTLPDSLPDGTYTITVTTATIARTLSTAYVFTGIDDAVTFAPGAILGISNSDSGNGFANVVTGGVNDVVFVAGGVRLAGTQGLPPGLTNCAMNTDTGCRYVGGVEPQVLETTAAGAGEVNGRMGSYVIPNPNTLQVAGYDIGSAAQWVILRFRSQAQALTSVGLTSFEASNYVGANGAAARGAILQWRTGYETDTLGYQLYRDDASGNRVRVTPSLIAGSSLTGRVALASGNSYAYWDPNGSPADTYWLEDVDLRGTKTLHGPFRTVAKIGAPPVVPSSPALSKLNDRAATATASELYTGKFGQMSARGKGDSTAPGGGSNTQWNLAAQNSVKISVREAGWYRITQQDLTDIGFNTLRVDPRSLKLYADGVELPIVVTGSQDGRFDATDTVEFFGNGVDTTTTDTRVYWLTAGGGAGKRAKVTNATAQNGAPLPYQATVERHDRSVYFAAVANGDAENFYGDVVYQPTPQALTLTNVNPTGTTARIDVALQGVTEGQHDVSVSLNGQPIGQLSFSKLESKTATFTVPHSLLVEGANVVTLTPASDGDITLVDYVRITYSHTAVADQNEAFYPYASRSAIRIDGFTNSQIRVVDVANVTNLQELVGTVASGPSGFGISLQAGTAVRQLYAFTPDRVLSPASMEVNSPSTWNAATNAAEVVIITHSDFAGSLAPLVQLRQSQGYRVAVVDVEDLYDEFSFGAHTPYAIRGFVQRAKAAWGTAPQFITLVGDASYDARDYFNVGNFDFVPTKLVDTYYIEAASDDWHTDLNGDEIPDVAIGRLPVRTAAEAQAVVAKIVAYETGTPNPTALLVADSPDLADYQAEVLEIQGLLPSSYSSQTIFRLTLGDAAARSQTLAALNEGRGIVHYAGHGSVDVWRGNILQSSDAAGLSNGSQASLVTISNCLNGYFTSPLLPGLGESLVTAPNGGAIAVWSSSGATGPEGQHAMTLEFYRQLFNGQGLTIGQAAMRAKSVGVGEVRRTWTLVGDPATRLR